MTTSTTTHGETSNSITERVAAGVALLDREQPGWDQRVNVETLAISSCTRCVLGQLYGDVSAGYEEHGIDDNEAWQFGFDQGGFNRRADYEYSLLTAEWRRVISERQLAVTR